MISVRRRAELRRRALRLCGQLIEADIMHGNISAGVLVGRIGVTRISDEEVDLVEQTMMAMAHRLIDDRVRVPQAEAATAGEVRLHRRTFRAAK